MGRRRSKRKKTDDKTNGPVKAGGTHSRTGGEEITLTPEDYGRLESKRTKHYDMYGADIVRNCTKDTEPVGGKIPCKGGENMIQSPEEMNKNLNKFIAKKYVINNTEIETGEACKKCATNTDLVGRLISCDGGEQLILNPEERSAKKCGGEKMILNPEELMAKQYGTQGTELVGGMIPCNGGDNLTLNPEETNKHLNKFIAK